MRINECEVRCLTYFGKVVWFITSTTIATMNNNQGNQQGNNQQDNKKKPQDGQQGGQQ